jgi:hypothetical protein
VVRALRVIASWVNHYDINYGNTFDSYVTVEGKSYVRHYLIDFGGTLGASTDGPMPSTYGHEYFFDLWRVFARILTLGLYYPIYERWDTIPYPAAGAWEARTFHPGRYTFLYPGLALENLTDADGYWAARIVMAFSDRQLRAVAREGRYRDPAVADYIAAVLSERRDIIGRYYYSRVNPLDRFTLTRRADGDYRLCFDDMAVEGGLEEARQTVYRYAIASSRGCPVCTAAVRDTTCLILPADNLPREPCRFVLVKIQTIRRDKASPLLCVYLRRREDGTLVIAGLRR